MFSNIKRYQLVTNVLFQKVDNETVILEPENGNYFTLDSVGTFIVENLQAGKNVEQVLELMDTTYDVPIEQATSDLQALITHMLSQNLIVEITDI